MKQTVKRTYTLAEVREAMLKHFNLPPDSEMELPLEYFNTPGDGPSGQHCTEVVITSKE